MKDLNILLLFCDDATSTATVDDHIKSLCNKSKNNIFACDSVLINFLDLDFDIFDVIVLHYSIVMSQEIYISRDLEEKIISHNGLKVAFLQDEYRWVDKTAEAMERLGVTVLFTVVNKDAIRKIYRHPWMENVRFEQTLTGFVPEHLLERCVPPYDQREMDVAYRARKVPSWLGEFGQEKWEIGQRFGEDAEKYGLRCDIAFSEAERIYGEKWIGFISGAKAVLGTESGASVIDFDDTIRQAVEAYEAQSPEASFDNVQDRCFKDHDGDVVIHVISPRCFEAAALRTLMILYPGEYSGVLVAGRHYVALEKDHSNMDEVVQTLRDPKRAGEIIENAYQEVACSGRWTFATMVIHFDNVVQEEVFKKVSAAQIDKRKDITDKQIAEWKANLKWYIYVKKLKFFVVRLLQYSKERSARLLKSLPEPIYDFAIKPLVPSMQKVDRSIRKWLLGSEN